MMSTTLVSCLMPTADRRAFVPRAIELFLAQDYPDKELLILDDGEDSVADLVPADARLRYRRELPRRVLGDKRNRLCELARGDVIVHWDDDDWSAPDRITRQLHALHAADAELCGLARVFFTTADGRQAWEYVYPAGSAPWVYGASLCYRKDFWSRHPFPCIGVGEDTQFVWADRCARIVAMPDNDFLVALVHPGNTSTKRTQDAAWHPLPPAHIAGLMAARDRASDGPATPNKNTQTDHPTRPNRGAQPMSTVARTTDLQQPEFAAFNREPRLPRMRQWELPYALYAMRLGETMSVLDCTINPVDFESRLRQLYPHVLYRHWNPLRQAQFVLPQGLPDGAFDRVMCINTLEHLLRPQREQLLEDLARKLKPGGRLVLTCDHYFDSFRADPAWLATGLLRADGAEVFNGFNQVTTAECLRLCAAHGLTPVDGDWEMPDEEDRSLLRQAAPLAHACIGGVFSKGPAKADGMQRTVVLALLTWNTCDISLDSVRALANEARMLQRLGQRPILCVCDNGSTDGTAEQLKRLDAELDLPHRFIFNASNVGNSVARNQIIDCFVELGGDHLLFMDGDIEIVPFSSFTMLRYLEHHGSRLGCIGACSAGQTNQRAQTSPTLFGINRVETTNLVAWTQYGMFRREVFEAGVRFDESGPFTGPGWGFEDNDLAFQMEMKGFLNQRFFGMTYLHRDPRSSVRVMKSLGIEPNRLYEQRKRHVIDKWRDTPAISGGPLQYVRAIEMRL